MSTKTDLRSLSDDALLLRLSELLNSSRRVESDLIAHIAEVDARELYARHAASSMFSYCTDILHLSEPETALRIHAARASRKHPILLEMLRDGRLHLSGIGLLAPHLTPENRQALLKRATHKSKRQIEEIVAELKPRPDAPSRMRKLPARRANGSGPSPLGLRPTTEAPGQHRPDDVASAGSPGGRPGGPEHRPDDVAARPAPEPRRRATVEPLAPARYQVQFTASKGLHDKLERLQALMRSSVPDGDLGVIIEAAVTEKLERLEAKRLGKTKKPRKSLADTDTTPSSRHIPAAVRRAVWKRDGGGCTYVDAHGRRCQARDHLEFHHHGTPFGRGGDHSPENIRLACRTHNALMAEQDFGKAKMAQYRRRRYSGGRVSEPAAVFGVAAPARSSTSSPPGQQVTGY